MQSYSQIVMGFQGGKGAFSERAVHEYDLRITQETKISRPVKAFGYETFIDALKAFYRRQNGSDIKNLADELLLPIRNNNSRSVTAMQKLLPKLDGCVVGEYYLLVEQCALVNQGVELGNITQLWTMEPAREQVTNFTRARKLAVTEKSDTAKAAEELKKSGRRDVVAIASPEAGVIYGLKNFGNVCNNIYNFTHFLHIVPTRLMDRFLPRENLSQICITKIILEGDLYPRSGVSPFQIFPNHGIRVHNPIDADSETFDHTKTILDLDGHCNSANMKGCFKELKRNGYEVTRKGCYIRHDYPRHDLAFRTRIPTLHY